VGEPLPLSLAGEEAKGYNGLRPFPWKEETDNETTIACFNSDRIPLPCWERIKVRVETPSL